MNELIFINPYACLAQDGLCNHPKGFYVSLLTCHHILFQLLIIILVTAIESDNKEKFVKPIMTLPETDQRNLMTIIMNVNDKSPDQDLSKVLQDTLFNPGKLLTQPTFLGDQSLSFCKVETGIGRWGLI